MDIIRRNTDYALRLMTLLVGFSQKKESISARNLSEQAVVPYPLTCKLLQQLQKSDIVKSEMGPKGGYLLARNPSQISFLDVIQTIQGPISINRCFLGRYKCPLKGNCPLPRKLMGLQNGIIDSLNRTKVSELVPNQELQSEI